VTAAAGYMTEEEEKAESSSVLSPGEFDNAQSFTGQVPSHRDCEVQLAVRV